MSFIKLYGNSLIITFNKNVIFQSPASEWMSEIDSNVPFEKGRPGRYLDAASESDDDEDARKELNSTKETKEHIVAVDVNESKSLLAIATDNKSFYLHEILDETVEGNRLRLLSRRLVARASNCIKFAPSGKFAIVCDKGGDCYIYDCIDYSKPGRWVLGHMSQVLDVLIDAEESRIITCDRDEKIRVTRYPDSHEIETFCLGHTEFVAQLEFVRTTSGQQLLSLSGDRTLRLWNYEIGEEMFLQKMDNMGTKLTTTRLHDGSILLAVLCYEPTKIIAYRLFGGEPVRCEYLQELYAKSNVIFSSIIFDKQHDLIALAIERNTEEVTQTTFILNQNNFHFDEKSVPKLLKDERLAYVDTTTFLFKKKFDNIKDYQNRKRKRVEEMKRNK
ncbi:tRNA (guanine-N(7)-)-methyltransferase non-catalytic subunit wuho [Sabethes cyaneus]|uniref:tRNA (guanine-N(7)-)-methyltransferase non-catalytic subunit wuho n=1 Tax=Sabethes cyaneus TaxID=53552 RepID=UPI00237EB121|nr:tRNA (guanine-N(7)-)-methyltransferase non-catalytic subunit wuho [Sabethes cyaneus]